MEASRAATGILEVLATRAVRFMIDSVIPSISTVSSGKSLNTSDISLPRSPQPTYMMTSEFEYLDKAWEMTVLPQPKAPGMAVVPPCTHLLFDEKALPN